MTSDNVDEVAQTLESLTSNPSGVDGRAVSLAASTLDSIIGVRDPSPEVSDKMKTTDDYWDRQSFSGRLLKLWGAKIDV